MTEPRVIRASWVGSAERPEDLLQTVPEVAVCGRSNVGKSSLINAVCSRKDLARTSSTPGRTQRIHVFDLDLSTGKKVRLVDLPGFGHAAASKAVRRQFAPMIAGWLFDRPLLRAVLLLQDLRREGDVDAQAFAEEVRSRGVGVFVVGTKADKLPKTQRFAAGKRLQAEFKLPRLPVLTSSEDGEGISELVRLLGQWAV
jgi:GTP-binding protein